MERSETEMVGLRCHLEWFATVNVPPVLSSLRRRDEKTGGERPGDRAREYLLDSCLFSE
jgi:hypothetical protein